MLVSGHTDMKSSSIFYFFNVIIIILFIYCIFIG